MSLSLKNITFSSVGRKNGGASSDNIEDFFFSVVSDHLELVHRWVFPELIEGSLSVVHSVLFLQ